MPAGNHYWFVGSSDEPLEILRVNYRVKAGARHGVNEGEREPAEARA